MEQFESLTVAEARHTIGDLCAVCGVTRRMVLNYEAHGLIRPIWVNPESGFRYYGAQSVARVRHIRSLQRLGFSLDQIGRFLEGDETAVSEHLARLRELRQELEEQIGCTEALLTSADALEIRETVFPGGHYAVFRAPCTGFQERFLMLWRHTARVLDRGWQVAPRGHGLIAIRHTDPDGPYFGQTTSAWALAGPNGESTYFPDQPVLKVHVKGHYSRLPEAEAALRAYARARGLRSTGDLRFAFLTSPQSHPRAAEYVTTVYLEL